ncbi:MAG: adenosylcobalamin-dependent ribonucleoside-diphosphate reductase [Candidatus Marinimicrobia bacterium]|jgi:ribonucleoside-diphosphate reductase alpha chain|nr:ribonucleoside-diphosphate reductase, adenosylcobalamin-dependent [Candidatus Neomarinimicrobiota bacterium]MDP6456907.1 adenosylcobalamin-dependent ribonucleoside-diphosphate reductase [Candidatus Neomarinimicrobiota bacterium]MDP6592784.1 adenosylcobalamin-dependent ribonucleoside-diphosphate reductase [Candidatus Neomarinimicrobiota bacterium]MDP6836305.1 adenosylcobalamin-dependent ribonucleoside-diphosphate reductase [Candidatus Neomarinimicrobiota bacterium]MDP6966275.1 adenosylcobalam|tara:strand:+ start:145 stop:2634 length:2490 start_codon:yes stop_codon:yes gene_type:complete
MAKAMQYEFPISGRKEKPSEEISQRIQIEAPESREKTSPTTDLPEVLGEATPPQYTVDEYYLGDDLGKEVLQNKYLAPWEKGPYDMWKRIAKAMASAEDNVDVWYQRFFSILEDFRFVPGGRIMHGAGREDITTTLNNCYVVAIRDDAIKAIYEAIQEEALTYKYGGGCGHDLSVLRPGGSAIEGTGGESCGPTGFMNLFSENTNTIAQHGRRGANMQTLRVDHPDIEKFVAIKRGNRDMVKYSNISVLLTREFMQAVEKDIDFDLRWGGKVYHTVKASDLWQKIVTSAHESAEPGIIFWDTMRDYHNAEYCSPLVSTNPCAEQPLPDGGCCNLGSINLERFVDSDGKFRQDEFCDTAATATRFMDNVVDYNMDRHALRVQKENAMNDRRIGIGLLGLGDMLVRMKIKYDSDEALKMAENVCRLMRDTVYETSVEIAREKGPFPNFEPKGFSESKFVKTLPASTQEKITKHGIRNSTLLTVPPTGSGAIVARVSSGIEPVFQTSYFRRVKQNKGYGNTFKEFKVYHPIVEKLFGTDEKLPDYMVTAHKIDPYFRVKMQGVIQQYIDSSISSTVNLPADIDKETVADIYLTAYKAGLKGITVYREGSREGILLTEEQQAKQQQETVPQEKPASVEIKPGDNEVPQMRSAGEQLELRPRFRPSMTEGVTKRIRTGEGSLYITINHDEHGLCEVFTTIGKAGGNAAAQSEAISRLISLALRSGIDPYDVVKQLKGISGPHPTWENGQLILSTPDAIGKALEEYIQESSDGSENADSDSQGGTLFSLADESETPIDTANFNPRTMVLCPDCGSTIFHEAGCVTCPSCGFSKCE